MDDADEGRNESAEIEYEERAREYKSLLDAEVYKVDQARFVYVEHHSAYRRIVRGCSDEWRAGWQGEAERLRGQIHAAS